VGCCWNTEGVYDVPNVMGVTPLMAAAGFGMEPSPRFIQRQ